jgi:hypothetical protein
MPIDHNFAKLQIARLAGTEGFASLRLYKNAGLKELIHYLETRCDNPMQAQRVITRCLESPRCPSVATLNEVIVWVQSEREPPPPPKYCDICGGLGYITSYELCTMVGDGERLKQPLGEGHAGFMQAQQIMDGWRQREREWSDKNPGKPQPHRPDQYIGEAARRCECFQEAKAS